VTPVLFFSRADWADPQASAAPAAPVLPTLLISFERQTIWESDRLPVHVVLANPSDKPLSNVSLSWSIPSAFLTLYPKACDPDPSASTASNPAFVWPLVPANKEPTSVQTHDFCLVSRNAGEDTFNLLFTLQYSYGDPGNGGHAVLTQEKSIKSAFLGSDTLAGVPLGLASLFIPGLLFWLLLDLFQTPWRVQGNVVGDKMIYSILVSLALIAVFRIMGPLKPYLDIAPGLNMNKVAALAFVGAASGFLVGGADRAWRWYQANQSLHPDDEDLVLFAKLLELNKGKRKPNTTVQTADGTRYRGSVGAQKDTQTYLVGWYQIEGAVGALKTKLDGLVQRGDYTTALKIAMKENTHLKVTQRDFIWKEPPGQPQNQFDALTRLVKAASEVPGPIVVVENASNEPLVVN
jgi:hypothetical protein